MSQVLDLQLSGEYWKWANQWVTWEESYSDYFNNQLENELQEAKKNQIDFGNEIRDYYDRLEKLEQEVKENGIPDKSIIYYTDSGIGCILGKDAVRKHFKTLLNIARQGSKKWNI